MVDERAVAEARALADPGAELVAELDAELVAWALADDLCLSCFDITLTSPWPLATDVEPACV